MTHSLSSIIPNAPPPAKLDELALSLVIAGAYGSSDRLLDSMAIADRPRLESRKSVTGALTETAIDLLPKPVAASGFRLIRLLVFWGSGVKRKCFSAFSIQLDTVDIFGPLSC